MNNRGHVIFILLKVYLQDKFLKMGLWSQIVCLYKFVRYCLIPIQKACTNFSHHQQSIRLRSVFSTLPPNYFSRDAEQNLSAQLEIPSNLGSSNRRKFYINVKKEEQKNKSWEKSLLEKKISWLWSHSSGWKYIA